ncbi:CPBP family intramembrane glutamic endopeptidase [Crassaminicella profunda]|uniref:CPBP family intramembrane glutamic endopeptidase n=1 Tax=Crassaminicella profunda TaxID=1286698 RepID=UPI001CA65CC2|nr:type II CAAX endopeptidase family protein [Crassaminicella profunda]QZY53981.1 CPBP family intramembrane metalloprotease [Crassaminicella profunda]
MFSKEKGLFLEAKGARYLPNIIVVLILAVAFLIGGEIIGGIAMAITGIFIFGTSNVSPLMGMMAQLIFGFLFVSLLIFAWVKLAEKRKISSMGFYKENFIKKYTIGFMVGVGLFTLVVSLLAITGHIQVDQNSTTPTGLAVLSSILIILPGWMIQSATEEILARGWMMNVLGARYNPFLGLGVSAIFFGVMHIFNPNVSFIAILNIILVGILLGLYVMKTKELWGVCGLHAAWNWVQGNIFGFEVSGTKTGIGSIMKLKLVGSEWFTGGAFGPEAGFAATIVLGLGIVGILLKTKRESKDIRDLEIEEN